VTEAEQKGIKVFIAAAGLSAALPGVVASHTIQPVIGVPVPAGPLKGVDALLSIVQMPGGIPVGAVGLGSNGPKNAALLTAEILSLADEDLRARLRKYREKLSEG
jgi:5-(carboxyamino)imidazole ribonucleotide mutase